MRDARSVMRDAPFVPLKVSDGMPFDGSTGSPQALLRAFGRCLVSGVREADFVSLGGSSVGGEVKGRKVKSGKRESHTGCSAWDLGNMPTIQALWEGKNNFDLVGYSSTQLLPNVDFIAFDEDGNLVQLDGR